MENLEDVVLSDSELGIDIDLRNRLNQALREIRSTPRANVAVIEELSQAINILNLRISKLSQSA